MSLIGKQITNYRLIELIKSGGYGSVYRAEHLFLPGHIAAVKLLHVLYGESEKERARFLQEARLLYQLKHPHILKIYDTGIDESLGVPYIVFDYAPGRSLRDRLKKQEGRLLSPGETLRVLTQIGQALEYAHQQNVIHLDLKPENILFNERGDALLSDFGIASVVEASIRQTGGIRGTAAYMSPEQFLGIESREADQYALGCLAYELCTGRRAFDNSWMAQAAKSTGEGPTPPRHYNPLLPVHIERAILRAMAPERTHRYPNISAFLHALSHAPEEAYSIPPTLPSQPSYPPVSPMPVQSQMPPAPAPPLEKQSQPRLETTLPASASALEQYNQGNKFYQMKLYDKALIAFNKAAHLEPRDARYQSARARASASLKFYQQAAQAFELAALLEPKVHDHLRGLGDALYELEEYEKAWQIFKKAAQVAPKQAYYYRMQGESLYKLRRYEEALDSFQASAQLDHKGSIYLRMQGEVLCDLGRYEEALHALEKAIEREPGNPVLRKKLEQIREQLKAQEPKTPPAQPQGAKSPSPAEKAKQAPPSPKASPAQAQGTKNAAEKAKQAPPSPKASPAQAQGTKNAAEKAKQAPPSPKEAQAPTQSAKSPADEKAKQPQDDPLASLRAGNASKCYNRGESLFKQKNFQHALIAFDEAVRQEPGNAHYRCGRGRALYALTLYEEALAAFNEAIRQKPNHGESYFRKAEALQALGRAKEAEQTLVQARQVEAASQKKNADKSKSNGSSTPQSQNKSAQSSAGKNGPAQQSTSKSGSAQNGAGKNGHAQSGSGKNKTAKNRTAQNKAGQENLLRKFWRSLLG